MCVWYLLNLYVILSRFMSLIHTLCWYIDHYHCPSLSSAVIRPRQIPQQGVQALNNINNNIEVENTASPVHSNRSSPSRVEGKTEAWYSGNLFYFSVLQHATWVPMFFLSLTTCYSRTSLILKVFQHITKGPRLFQYFLQHASVIIESF